MKNKRRNCMKNWTLMAIIAFFGVIAGFTACSTDDNDNGNKKLGFIDIVNASQLYVARASNSRLAIGRVVSGRDTLFKITEDGFVEEVTYKDENGNEIKNYQAPFEIFNVNDSYVIANFWDGKGGKTGYLVRKADGAVFSLDNVGMVATYPPPQSDVMGNIYFVIGVPVEGNVGSTLVKIDTSNPDRLTKVDWIVAPPIIIDEGGYLMGGGIRKFHVSDMEVTVLVRIN
jgi:hypothetical protein